MGENMFAAYENTVEMRVIGLLADKFFDAATARGVLVQNMHRTGNREIRATIRVQDIGKLRILARKTMCKVYFAKRRGVKFVARALLLRAALPLLLAAAIIFMYEYTAGIRIISVYGNESTPKEQILSILEEYGVKRGMKNDGEFLRRVEERFMLENSGFSYIALKNEGVYLDVCVVEKGFAPAPYDPSERRDIVAAMDGVVTRVEVFEGTARVKAGQTVRSGQILIEGSENGAYVAALGNVEGTVWYVGSAQVSMKNENLRRTGRCSVFRRLKTPWVCVIIDQGEEFERNRKETASVLLLDGFFAGMELETTTCYELDVSYTDRSCDQAQAMAEALALEDAAQKLPFGYVPQNITYSGGLDDTQTYSARALLKVNRAIAKYQYY